MHNRWRLALRFGLPLVMIVGLSLALLFKPNQQPSLVKTTTQLHMGTLVSISTWDKSYPQHERAVNHAFAEIARVEQQMSQHQPTSEVSKINRVSRETRTPVSVELATLLRQGLMVWQHSNGAFAMDLQPLTNLWGFSSDTKPSQPPSEKALANWLQNYPKTGGIELQGDVQNGFQLRLKNSGTGLDLGGIAKGYAIDRAIEILRREGINNGMVDAGGDLRIIGDKGGSPWRIGLQHPHHSDRVIAVAKLSGDIAMVTSGDYERFFFHEENRYHHLLDPRTAKPSRSGLSSVSVQAKSAALADALSTAIFILGEDAGLALLQQFPDSAVLLITESGEYRRSPGFVGEWLGNTMK